MKKRTEEKEADKEEMIEMQSRRILSHMSYHATKHPKNSISYPPCLPGQGRAGQGGAAHSTNPILCFAFLCFALMSFPSLSCAAAKSVKSF
ncbi:hypothetical protein V2J09_008984 [Rumex salicifolius]